MYSELWSPELRQGDILVEIPFPVLPRRKLEWKVTGGLTSTAEVVVEQPRVQPKAETVIVLSHDCEFNEGKRSHFLVSRVEGISSQLTEQELEDLRFGNDYDAASKAGKGSALDTFVLDELPGVFTRPMRANFAAITSIPMEWMAEALKQKRAELTHETRVLFRHKAGIFFGRDADDVADEEKRPAPNFS